MPALACAAVRRPRTVAGGLAVAVALLAGAACGGDDGGGGDGVGGPSPLPAELEAFLDRTGPPGRVAFTAGYEVLQKMGGTFTAVEVAVAPPAWQVSAGDVVVIGGPDAATCRVSTATCRRGIDEAALSSAGVFSGFFADAPARQLRAAAGREGAAEAVFSSHVVAGVALDCAVVPTAPLTACLTPEGVFGLVDDSARRYGLTSYAAGPPPEPIAPPFPVG